MIKGILDGFWNCFDIIRDENKSFLEAIDLKRGDDKVKREYLARLNFYADIIESLFRNKNNDAEDRGYRLEDRGYHGEIQFLNEISSSLERNSIGHTSTEKFAYEIKMSLDLYRSEIAI